MRKRRTIVAVLGIFAAGLMLAFQPATAQTPALPPPYGPPITLDVAKQIMAAAEAEAEKNKWPVVITIVDSGANVVMMHRRDDAQLAAIQTAEGKARTALLFKRSTKLLDEVVTSGGAGLRYLALKDFLPLEGGIPIVIDGKIVGAIGVSGVLSGQDTQIARAGIDTIAK